MSKPSLPKGLRDFLPREVARRKSMFDVMRSTFERYGYVCLETPTMESLQTLTGKYGNEGDQLLFKILNNGDYLKKADSKALEDRDSKKLTPSISKRGLRYDLTVPLARYVVMHQNEIYFPFKRYQMQSVWRADRPQKGRYQEFYQCDVDVLGSDQTWYESELIQIYDEVFDQLGLNVVIRINHRSMLKALLQKVGLSSVGDQALVILDKLDKIGLDEMLKQLVELGLSADSVDLLTHALTVDDVRSVLLDDPSWSEGLAEIESILGRAQRSGLKNEVKIDLTLARGLDYYTGCIFEVSSLDVEYGSLGGGGRYADLTAKFGLKGVSGVGISFGAERIYNIMEELNLFQDMHFGPDVLILCEVDEGMESAFDLLTAMRQAGIRASMYPQAAKLKKQFKYAERSGAKHLVIIGQQEHADQRANLKIGEEKILLPLEDVVQHLSYYMDN